MITHKRNEFITRMFSGLARKQLKKNFRRVSLTRRSVMPVFERNVPTIAILNHSSWWDAMICLYLGYHVFKREYYGVFAEEQLERYGIFRYAGCYSVNRDSAKDFRRFLTYSRDLLDRQSRLLWIFPQGEIVSNHSRPFEFKKGFCSVASGLEKVQILRLSVSYEFWIDSKPEIVIDVLPTEILRGQDIDADTAAARYADEISESVSYVSDIAIQRNYSAITPLFETEHGTNPVYDAWRKSKFMFQGKKFISSHGENISG